jgi:RNA polymerase sigma factor (sigma-70 family)
MRRNKKQITNDELYEAKQKYAYTIKRTTEQYRHVLSIEVREACGDMALWKCLQCYDPSFNQSVSSSLFRFIHWECRRALRDLRPKTPHSQLHENVTQDETQYLNMIINDCLGVLCSRDRRIIEDRYLYQYTLQEIANKEGCSRQGVKHIIDRCLNRMSKAS